MWRALRDAQILLAVGSWSSAYYLDRYAVEFAIKACVVKTFQVDTIPGKQRVTYISAKFWPLGHLGMVSSLRRPDERKQLV